MPKAYSIDLRRKAVAAYENEEGTLSEIAAIFSIGRTSLVDYLKRKRKTGDVLPTKYVPGPKTTITTKGLAYIRWVVEHKPDIILAEICKKYLSRFKKKVSPSMICRALKKMGLRRKKKSIYAVEQERDDVKKNERNFKK
jgi:transposase